MWWTFVSLLPALVAVSGSPVPSQPPSDPLAVPSREILQFMRQFGYLESAGADSESLYSDEAIRDALRQVQKFGGVAETGELDAETVELLSAPRCGTRDIVAVRGGARRRRFAIGGRGWRKRTITYFIANWSGKLGQQKVAKLIRRAFDLWSKYSRLRFKRVFRTHADIIVAFGYGFHGDNYPFDGPGNVLAHAFYPYEENYWGGDIHFDDAENWKTASNGSTKGGVDFFTVAVHELGHSLGLAHSFVPSAIMFPYYRGAHAGAAEGEEVGLDYDDILGLYNLYIRDFHDISADEYVSTFLPPSTTTPLPTTDPAPPATFFGDFETVLEHRTRFATTEAPPTPLPDVCHGDLDAAAAIRGEIFLFKGALVWRLHGGDDDEWQLREGFPAPWRRAFPGLPPEVERVDAAYEREDRGDGEADIVLFSGRRYWSFDGLRVGEARPISDFGLDGDADRVDAATVWAKNGKTYLFSGNRIWRYNETERALDEGYPMGMDRWHGIPAGIDAAITLPNAKTYFFRGAQFWLYNNRRVRPERRYPKPVSQFWAGCQA